jgi:hypothetical protein
MKKFIVLAALVVMSAIATGTPARAWSSSTSKCCLPPPPPCPTCGPGH